MWWETLPAQIVLWSAAAAALGSLARRIWKSSEFLRKLIIFNLSIGLTEKWPNGSTDLPSALSTIYDTGQENNKLIRDLKWELRTHIDDKAIHGR